MFRFTQRLKIKKFCSRNRIFINTFTFLLGLYHCHLSASQHIGLGFCPKVHAMPNFNITKYEGRWFHHENYRHVFEATFACVTVKYLDRGDETFSVDILLLEKVSRKWWKDYGITRFLKHDGSGDVILDLLFTQSPIPFHIHAPYMIVHTDYTSYTIKFMCQQVGPLNLQLIWIMGRNRTFSEESRKAAHAKLVQLGMDSTRLGTIDQESCPPSVE